jgi:tetratricopeptide (TPR) repeat protein
MKLTLVFSFLLFLSSNSYGQKSVSFYFEGISNYSKQNYNGAIKSFNKAIKEDSKYDAAYHFRGMVKDQIGDFIGALTDINKAIELKPNNPDYIHYRGIVKNNLKDYNGAIDDENKAIELKPDGSYIFFRGIVKYNLIDYNGALDDLNKAIELKPEESGYYSFRATIKNNLKDYTGSVIKGKKDYSIQSNRQAITIRAGFAQEVQEKIEYPNLVKNGDFEDGNVGLKSDFKYVDKFLNWGCYVITDNAAQYLDGKVFLNPVPYTGKYYFIDMNNSGKQRLWYDSITVKPNTTYSFTCILANVNAKFEAPGVMNLKINGRPGGPARTFSNGSAEWTPFSIKYKSGPGETRIEISIVDEIWTLMGNDVALDNIVFKEIPPEVIQENKESVVYEQTDTNYSGVSIKYSCLATPCPLVKIEKDSIFWISQGYEKCIFKNKFDSKGLMKSIDKLRLDTLSSYYVNNYADDGIQLDITLSDKNKEKEIHISNYYLSGIDSLVKNINQSLPDSLKLAYPKDMLIRFTEEGLNHNLIQIRK